MITKKLVLTLLILAHGCLNAQESVKREINSALNQWHKAAAAANFKEYFSYLTDDSIFIGTDATENWNKTAFEAFAKPYFEKGKAWDFTPMERHIYFSEDGKTAWFDELLDTQMKICRGSGVLILTNNSWKIKQYVLSMTIPNKNTDEVVKIKTPIEEVFLSKVKRMY
ncbi:nuclear transport factor 2 family protein [Flavobacterium sp.]|uniref:nuclear transport factor 2 family protein n=1 Tax=Flavobacterium sp. TaxID=239 RepID=UPI003BCD626A